MKYRLLLILLFLFSTIHLSFGQVQFSPLQENFNSIEEWKDPINWTIIAGKSNTGYPTSADIIVIQNTRLKLDSLIIDFNLDEISTSLTYHLIRQDFTLRIKENGIATFLLTTKGNQTASFIIDGNLKFKGDVVFPAPGIRINVNGTLNIENDLTFRNSNNLLSVSKSGELTVGNDFISNNGGKSSYNSDGKITIENNYTNNGGAELTVLENGHVIIKGNKISKNGGGGLIDVKGRLEILQTCDLYGSEDINIYANGYLSILGDLILSCSKSINVMKRGEFVFGKESQCIIREGKCYDSSTNLKICNVINDRDLPVELAHFYGKIENELNVIYWETYSEYNSSHYELQSSNDNISWNDLTRIEGAGNKNTPTNYSYIDSLNTGKFYRLKQVDFDGANETYGPITLNNTETTFHVKGYPNVVNEGSIIYLEINGVQTNQKVKAYLMSVNGKYAIESDLSVNIEGNYLSSYVVPNVPSGGLYILRFIANKSTYQMKVLVQ